MATTIELDWYYTTSWDLVGFGKIKVNYTVK